MGSKRAVSKEKAKEVMLNGWSFQEARLGYALKNDGIIEGAKFIHLIKETDAFDTEEDASKYAEEHDKTKVIHDLPDCLSGDEVKFYVDTEENRAVIREYVQNKYNIRWVQTISVVSRELVLKKLEENKEKFGSDTGLYITMQRCIQNALKFRRCSADKLFITMGVNEYFITNKTAINSVLESITDVERVDNPEDQLVIA